MDAFIMYELSLLLLNSAAAIKNGYEFLVTAKRCL
jgi:hypothetical protein